MAKYSRRRRKAGPGDRRDVPNSLSHPLVEAITTWDFKDGAWLNAPSGFLRKDLSKKPSYDMLKKIVKDEWWTDTTVKTDENGRVNFSGFKGEYKLTAGDICADATLTDDQEMVVKLV